MAGCKAEQRARREHETMALLLPEVQRVDHALRHREPAQRVSHTRVTTPSSARRGVGGGGGVLQDTAGWVTAQDEVVDY